MNKFQYNINLIKELAWTDFKLKYYGSALGLVWTFLKPFLMLIILYIVFTQFIQAGIENYHVYLLLGIVIWNFFADATKDSMRNMLNKINILQKVNVSPLTIILSSILNSTTTFFINIIIFFILFFALKQTLTISVLFFIPLIILTILLVTGISCITSILYMKFTDFEHIWDVSLQILFWATPIVYAANSMPEKYVQLFMLNPVARIMVDSRNVILYHFVPEIKQTIITVVIVATLFIAGILLFKKYSKKMIDQL